MPTASLFLAALLSLAVPPAPPKKTVLIITDAEGVAGICRQEQTEPTNPELQKLLTGEVNAAVRGFLKAGAEEVIVWDGHDGSRTLSASTLEPRARLVIGSLGPTMMLERGFAAVAFVGQHARAGREAAVMAHSYSSLGIQRILMNGREVGEIETRAALAGWFGTPVVFLSGDQAAADDLRAIVPEAGTAVVKEGLGYYTCLSLAAERAQELIEGRAALALTKAGQTRPYRVEGPVSIEVEYATRSTLFPEEPLPVGAERIGPRTLRFSGRDFLAAWRLWSQR
jgi:D-amino peptidase